ncbi:MAG: hypothetical protein ACP5JU_03780 [Minisyncoccia bacterium]
MFLLVYFTKKNKEIVYKKGDYVSYILTTAQYPRIPGMAIPKMNGKLNFIKIIDWDKATIAIVNVSAVAFEFSIHYR